MAKTKHKITFDSFTRAYAEEYYYVLINQNALIKHPERRIKYATKSFLFYLVFSGCFTFIALAMVKAYHNLFPILFIPVLTLVASAHTYYRVRKSILALAGADTSKFRLMLATKQLTFGAAESGNDIVMLWDEVKKIIFTDNSIIFLPISKDIFPIVVPISAKKDVEAILKKLNIQ